MINNGDTIVYSHEDGSKMFYWLCGEKDGLLVFFNWYSDINNPSTIDFWKMRKSWLESKIKEGKIAVFSHFPEEMREIFDRQAEERNMDIKREF